MPANRRQEKPEAAPLRVAVIGAGSMARTVHYPSLASFPDVEIAAICDLDAERLRETADQYGVERRYSDYRRMIEEIAPEGVYAIGQPHLMYDVWVWCLREGLNLYVEKPLGITLHQARALAHLAEERGCLTQVSFQRRSCPLLVKLRQRCLRHGPITHAVCEFYKCAPQPYLEARDHMRDDGVHALDTLRWMCGGEVAQVESDCRRVGTPDLNFIAALLHFDNGATGVMLNSWTSGRRVFRVEMHAPGVCAEADPETGGRLYAEGDTEGQYYETREVAGGEELFVFGGFQAKHREFLDGLAAARRGKRKLPSSHFGDAVRTMELAERILAQALLAET